MNDLFFIISLLIFTICPQAVFAKDNHLNDSSIDVITEGIYVIHGINADPSPENAGFINNPGFVTTEAGVVVIDPGSSHAIGEMILRKIKSITNLPVIAIFNTHEHGDHWLANHAIVNAFPNIPIYAHLGMIEAIENGAGITWRSLLNQLTNGSIKTTEIMPPTHPVKNGDEIKLGEKTFRIHHYGTSHTDSDIMLEVIESKTVFLGDNASIGRLPRLDDGDIAGNIATLNNILMTQNQYYVPGHGSSGDKSVPATYLQYLTILYNTVNRLYQEGLSDFEMKQQVQESLEKFSAWYGFNSDLGRNISLVFLQIESADF